MEPRIVRKASTKPPACIACMNGAKGSRVKLRPAEHYYPLLDMPGRELPLCDEHWEVAVRLDAKDCDPRAERIN